ncbi:sugar phosphate nucleotidyltransferase [Prosthecochloris sp. HL-130-GSB]|jgi:glucose-1-phosphate thymidylyltransferase|uniref:Nucleotidyl transferase n=1 Tax=Prosthecochloris aestuarii TaxID=1102 RepID=A0A831WQR4_PROAE|nr:sugar phosphate nucleotidyltransferase [Prosthecochloris sp. HL-130-GSB]ARM31124.1 nucleotidyl transferase [Prosthecochloris sp. HL-130-GSB]MBO8092050.1 NTP transferase domain-containing protein [Prosthecochloris sp.]HED30160.1 nucleotidyl transferase [Prosthecochloris aestuarii]
MKAIIPVAGVGTRLRPHTFSQPKVLVNVAGKPIIGHIMDKLTTSGIDEAIVIVGYLGDMIETYLRQTYPDVRFTFVTQKQMLGLAHAIWLCREHVSEGEPLFIILGDTIFDVELSGIFQSTQSTLGVKQVEDPRRFGIALTEGERIVKLIEKPDQPVGNQAIVGLYFLTHAGTLFSSLDYLIDNDIKTKGEFQLTDALQHMIETGESFTTFPVKNWYDCGKPETLLSTNRVLLGTMENSTRSYPGCVINEPVYIAESAKLENAIVGPDATIGEDAVISDAIITDSIIGNGAKVEKVMLQGSIVGSKAAVSGSRQEINIGDFSEIKLR